MDYSHKVVVFGGRKFVNTELVDDSLDRLLLLFGRMVIIQGGANGADFYAKQWGQRNGQPGVQIDALWDYYKNSAGPIRNHWMVDIMHPNYAVGFPGENGTADMTKYCLSKGIPLWRPAVEMHPVSPLLQSIAKGSQ